MKTLVLSIIVITMAYISNAQDYVGTFEFDGYEREYEVYLPQDFAANMPLIVSLHGAPETVYWYKTYTFMHEVADTLGYVIVYPHGIGKSWNCGLIEPGEYFPDTDDVGYISALIDTMKTRWDIDLSRVYCCGFSLGGMMSYRMAGELGHRLGAIASVSGPLFGLADIWQPIQPMPVLYMHGTMDGLCPYNGKGDFWSARNTINYWLENNECTAEADTFTFPDIDPGDGCTMQKFSYTSCSGESEVIHYKGINMGHSWPGTPSDITFPGEGNRNMDINANVEILNFFKQFKNPLVSMAYSKSMEVYPFYIQSTSDTIAVRVHMNNPENHAANVYAFIHGEQFTYKDSIRLYDDGLHEDGDSADNSWGNKKILAGLSENVFKVDLLTHDLDLGTEQYYHLPAPFISFGPVAMADHAFTGYVFFDDSVPNPGELIKLELKLQNESSIATATNIKAELISLDTLVSILTGRQAYDDIAAGAYSTTKNQWTLNISDECPGNTEIPILVNISSYNNICWSDTINITVLPVSLEDNRVPTTRIYPNPVNDLITIETGHPGQYSIEISSLNGQLLYSDTMEGPFTQIDLSFFPNGLYFISIRSKDFAITKKIVKL